MRPKTHDDRRQRAMMAGSERPAGEADRKRPAT